MKLLETRLTRELKETIGLDSIPYVSVGYTIYAIG